MMIEPTKMFGILAIVPVTVLLTLSFFVMVVLRKLEEGALRSFGRIVGALICAAAFLIFTIGLYVVGTGNCPIVDMIGRCGISKYEKSPTCGMKDMSSKMMQKGMMHKGMTGE